MTMRYEPVVVWVIPDNQQITIAAINQPVTK